MTIFKLASLIRPGIIEPVIRGRHDVHAHNTFDRMAITDRADKVELDTTD